MEYFQLRNGALLPKLGFGVYKLTGDECRSCVLSAIEVGYRLIDTADAYGNEAEVGAALGECGVAREKIFLTTKVRPDNYGGGKTRTSVLRSLEKLGVSRLDLCLLHQPYADYYSAWRELEQLHREGLIGAIGVSNFYPNRIIDLCSFVEIPPMVNQIELHPLFQQPTALEWNEKYGVQLQAWSPLGAGRGGLTESPLLVEIGNRYGKTAAQVALRWNIQRGVSIIPKTSKKERMVENFSLFDFSLTEEEMGLVSALDTGKSSFYFHHSPEQTEKYANAAIARRTQAG